MEFGRSFAWLGLSLFACSPPEPESVVSATESEVEVAADAVARETTAATVAATSPTEAPPSLPVEAPPPVPDDGSRLVGEGDSLSRILAQGGLSAQDAHRLIVALEPHMDVTMMRPGQRYRLTTSETGPEFELELETTRTLVARGARAESGSLEFSVEARVVPTRTLERNIVGHVESTLWDAVKDAGEDPALVSVLADAFAYDIDFHSETRKGDRFRILVERIETEERSEFVRFGRVLAATYEGEATGEHRMYWFEPAPGKGAFYDAEGRGVARSFLKSPLKFTRISSEFDPKRMHPILHREKGHMGTDYAAPEGTPVWAAASGRISSRSTKGGAGNMVVIDHGGGLVTLYMHLSRFEDGQKVGTTVKQKDVIGYVGMTGLATGPHLHFGVRKGGRYVDPATVENARAPGVPKQHRAAFDRARKDLDERLLAEQSDSDPGR